MNEYPYNTEIEKLVLLSVFISDDNLLEVFQYTDEDDFYNPYHRSIFNVICKLYNDDKNIDRSTVKHYINDKKTIEVFNDIFTLTSFKNDSLKDYLAIINDLKQKRKLFDATLKLQKQITDSSITAKQLAEEYQISLLNALQSDQKENLIPIANDISEIFHNIISGEVQEDIGIKTNITDVDSIIGSFKRGEFVILGGRPSMGKTALSIQFAIESALQGKETLFFSIEQPRKDIILRIVAYLSKVPLTKIQNKVLQDYEVDKIAKAVELIKTLPLTIDDTPITTATTIATKTRKFKKLNPNLELVIIDYLQLLQFNSIYIVREVSDASKTFKVTGRLLNICVCALSQLSRECERRDDKRPILSDLKESGSLEQDGDKILFVYSDYPYTRADADRYKSEIICAKNRNGAIGTSFVTYNKLIQKFYSRSELPPDNVGLNIKSNDDDFF